MVHFSSANPHRPAVDSFLLVRFALFGAAVLGLYQLIYLSVLNRGVQWTGRENGPIEAMQAILAATAALCLFGAAIRSPIGRTGMWLSGSLAAYAAAREYDTGFEQFFFVDAYKWLIGLPLVLVAVGVLWTHRNQIASDSIWLMSHPAAVTFAMAGIYLCTVCQLLDRPLLWSSASVNAEALLPLKMFVEELAELFAYLIVAFAAVESVILARHTARSAGDTASRV